MDIFVHILSSRIEKVKNKELELLASLKKACRLMDEIDTFKNEIALAEVQEYLKAIRFKSLWYVDFER